MPAEISKALDVHPGDQISWEVKDGEVRVRKLVHSPEPKSILCKLVRRGGALIMVMPDGSDIPPDGIAAAIRAERDGDDE